MEASVEVVRDAMEMVEAFVEAVEASTAGVEAFMGVVKASMEAHIYFHENSNQL